MTDDLSDAMPYGVCYDLGWGYIPLAERRRAVEAADRVPAEQGEETEGAEA